MRIELGSAAHAAQAALVASLGRIAMQAKGFPGDLYSVAAWQTIVNDAKEPYEVMGAGASRVALLGPDDVVYKAEYNSVAIQHWSESLIFDTLDRFGADWCPDYWPFDAHRVMAMRRYVPLTAAEIAREASEFCARVGLRGDCHQWGRAANGQLVLLDGGTVELPPSLFQVSGIRT